MKNLLKFFVLLLLKLTLFDTIEFRRIDKVENFKEFFDLKIDNISPLLLILIEFLSKFDLIIFQIKFVKL